MLQSNEYTSFYFVPRVVPFDLMVLFNLLKKNKIIVYKDLSLEYVKRMNIKSPKYS